jgi:uncharacterized membrane protein
MELSAHGLVLLAHVAAATLWLGGSLVTQLHARRMLATDDSVQVAAFMDSTGRIGSWLLLPAALVVVLSGGWLMQSAELRIAGNWWLGAGIGLWVVAFLAGAAVLGGEARRVAVLAREQGAQVEEVRWRIRRLAMLGRGELLLLGVALALMVLRPT